jgi:hypothetical protein
VQKNIFNRKKIAFLHFAILIIALLFMFYMASKQSYILYKSGWSFDYGLLSFSVIGVVVLIFLSVYGWYLILQALGKKITYHSSVFIWSVSFPSRYIPGGIWSYASRASLAKAEGVEISTAIMSMYIETLLVIVSSITIGIIAFFLLITDFPIKIEIIVLFWIGSIILVHPKFITPLLKFFSTKINIPNICLADTKTTFKLSAYYILYWVLCGGFFLCFVLSIYPVNYKDWLLVGSSFPLCYFIGFIVLFAPGGIGIRESALYMTLSSVLPDEVNLLVSIGSRLWLIAGEVLFLLMAYLLKLSEKTS